MDQYDILRFDISVQYFIFMHKLQSIKQITDNEGGSFFRKSWPVGDDIEQLAITSELKYNINILLVMEISVNFDYVWMV